MDRIPRRKYWYEECPLYQKWAAESTRDCTQDNILRVLRVRLGKPPEKVVALVRSITDLAQLHEALRHSVRCRTIGGFQKRIHVLLRDWKDRPVTESK